jgi:hypothetical protein
LKKLSWRFREDSKSIEKVVMAIHRDRKSIEKVVTSMVDAEHASGRLDP